VPRRGVIKRAPATFSHVVLTGKCLAGQFVSSLRSDTLLLVCGSFVVCCYV